MQKLASCNVKCIMSREASINIQGGHWTINKASYGNKHKKFFSPKGGTIV